MELADRLQALEPPGQSVREIPEQRVDELLQVVPLVGPDRYEVVEDLVVAPGMEIGLARLPIRSDWARLRRTE